MKRSLFITPIFFSLVFACALAPAVALGQKGCEFQIVGTWEAASPDGANAVVYRFGSDATVTVLFRSGAGLSTESREILTGVYALDNLASPRALLIKAAQAGAGLDKGANALEISAYDDTSITITRPGSPAARWVRADPHRYFLVLAGRSGIFYDRSGPTFPMLIKTDGSQTEVAAVGIYSSKGQASFGPVPAETYGEFMKEPRAASDVMLRLELTGAQYEKELKIIRTWERRVREGALLYPDVSMDNILLAKQVTEGLNQCGEKIKLYNLDWGLADRISETNRPPLIPFFYFKELRRLNESLHVSDEKFNGAGRAAGHRAGR